MVAKKEVEKVFNTRLLEIVRALIEEGFDDLVTSSNAITIPRYNMSLSFQEVGIDPRIMVSHPDKVGGAITEVEFKRNDKEVVKELREIANYLEKNGLIR